MLTKGNKSDPLLSPLLQIAHAAQLFATLEPQPSLADALLRLGRSSSPLLPTLHRAASNHLIGRVSRSLPYPLLSSSSIGRVSRSLNCAIAVNSAHQVLIRICGNLWPPHILLRGAWPWHSFLSSNRLESAEQECQFCDANGKTNSSVTCNGICILPSWSNFNGLGNFWCYG